MAVFRSTPGEPGVAVEQSRAGCLEAADTFLKKIGSWWIDYRKHLPVCKDFRGSLHFDLLNMLIAI